MTDVIQTEMRRTAASELLAMHDLMMRSESQVIQAFGVLVLARLADLVAGKSTPYLYSDEELREAARIFRDNVRDEDEPGGMVQ